jgi:LysR family glycine cleavage system transcriptional activator
MDDLPSLHALRCLEAAARHSSMSRAATELCVTHGAISRQVRQLEEHLGVALFVRGHRRIELTREGAALAHAVGRGLQSMRDGVGEVRRLRGGPLVVSCEPTLTLSWLVPRLPRAPELELQVVQGGGPIELERAGVDVALRRGDFDLTSHFAALVMDEWLGPVCAPRLVVHARRGTGIPMLHTRTRMDAWSSWASATGVPVPSGKRHVFDHFATSLSAAVAGLGIAIGPYALVHDQLAARHLVAPFGFVRGPIGYHLLSRRPFDQDPRVSRLLAWLRAEATRTHRRVPRHVTGGAAR